MTFQKTFFFSKNWVSKLGVQPTYICWCLMYKINEVYVFHSLQDMVEIYSPVVHMKRMMKRQMRFMIPLTKEWMIEEKKEGVLMLPTSNSCHYRCPCFSIILLIMVG